MRGRAKLLDFRLRVSRLWLGGKEEEARDALIKERCIIFRVLACGCVKYVRRGQREKVREKDRFKRYERAPNGVALRCLLFSV